MQKTLFLLALLFLSFVSPAATYYFSSISGDDSRTIQQAQNPATPWKSLDQFNTINRSLQPGDSVLFKRGETFYGAMLIKSRGSLAAGIYFGAYGNGSNPVISGFTTVSNWTSQKNGIYSAPLDALNLQMVTINGEAKGMGRYPNTGFLNYENNNGNASITDNELPASPNWTGGEIVMRKYRFILDRHSITSHAGLTINYSTSTINGNNSAFSPVKGNGYFIQNHLGTLDQFGEWYYDTTAKRLYVFFGANSPANYVVKASTKDFNITVSTSYFLKFENLDFEGANTKGLNLINVSNTLVQNCNFYNQGATSLYGIDLNEVKVEGGNINTSFSNSILFENNANNCSINGVSINNTNTIPGTGRSGSGVSIGILVSGENIRITNNRVVNSGYNGIQFIGDNVLVEKNYIDTFCTLKDDGGGIYTYTGSSNETAYNRIIRNNIVLNAVGARASAEAYYYEPFGKAAGIYLDEYANGVEITGNTVANGDWAGIFLHFSHTNTVKENLFYNHRYQVLVSQYVPATRNMLMTDNQYIAKLPSQVAFCYNTTVNDSPAAMGTFNYNYYARPADDNASVRIENFYTGGNGTSNLSLAQWKAAYGLDSLSQKSPLTFSTASEDNIRFEYNASPSVKSVSLGTTYLDVKNNQYNGSLTLQPFTSVLLLKSNVVAKNNQTIGFGAIANKTAGDAPFTLTATASSGLPVSYRVSSGPATVSGNTVTINNAGTVTIMATQQGNNSYAAAASVSQSFVVAPNPNNPPPAKTAQTISFGTLGYRTWGMPPFNLSASSSSGLPVNYRVVSGPAVVSNRTVSVIGVGTVTIEATQAGNQSYSAAAPVQKSFGVGKSNQTISFPNIPNKTDADPPFALTATASSSLPISYRVVSGPASVSGNIVTVTGVGTVTIEASQAGDELTNAAYSPQRSFTVIASGNGTVKQSQTISFSPLSNKTYGDTPFSVTATASSGLPVSFRVVSGPASITGNAVTLTGAGQVFIEASQIGNQSYNAATPVTQNFSVAKASQTISFGALADRTYGDAPFQINALASSGLQVSYRVTSGTATVSGNTITLTGAGTVSIEASQNGDANYNAANAVVQSFTVRNGSTTTKQAQTITFGSLAYKNYSSPPFDLTATASSGLPVAYRVVSGPISISGKTVTITGVGFAYIEASQGGDAAYNAATPVTRSFQIGKAGQTINFPTLPNKTYGDPVFNVNATASSGLPVNFRIVSGPATVSGSTVTLTGAGTVTIEALQPGNDNFSAAYSPQRSFTVAAAVSTATATIPNTQEKTTADALPIGVELFVFPNPVQGQGTVRIIVPESVAGVLAIYDQEGKLVKSLGYQRVEKGLSADVPMNTDALSKGNYFIRFSTTGKAVSRLFQVL